MMLAILLAANFACHAQASYTYVRIGSQQDVATTPSSGFALMGGGKDLDEAFQWMCTRANGGDFLVLRAAGDDAYNPYLQSLCRLNSVATLIIPTREASNNAAVAKIISTAEAIFIAGGDQARYINFWDHTPVQQAINEAIRRGVPVGGTSAGLAVLGEFVYSAQNDPPEGPNLDSVHSLLNPLSPQITLVKNFLDIPLLKDTITDSHFVKRDRMGRLVTMLARIQTELNRSNHSQRPIHGIGIDEQTAVLIQRDGKSQVVGKTAAYFLTAASPPQLLSSNSPLEIKNIDINKVAIGGSFDLASWKTSTPARTSHYALTASSGKLTSSQQGKAIY